MFILNVQVRLMSFQFISFALRPSCVPARQWLRTDCRRARDSLTRNTILWRNSEPRELRCNPSCAGSESGSSKSSEDAAIASELKEVEQLDRLIDALLDCKSKEQLAKVVTENVLSFKQKFWLRLAARADTDDPTTRERMESLSRAVMTLTEAIVKMSETQLEDASELAVSILKAAADERGQWEIPLAPERVVALEAALVKNKSRLNEGFLATIYAWMRKSEEEKVQGMVPLLQKVLQLYSAVMLQEENPTQIGTFINSLMREEPSAWCAAIKTATTAGTLSESGFKEFIQMKLEKTIELPGGSYEQRVQVEFLTELLEQCGKGFCQDTGKGSSSK